MSDSFVPRGAERLLEALGADRDLRDSVIGDLAEEFEIRLQWDGPGAARRWYYRESLRVAPYLLRDWWRGLRWRHIGYFASVVLLSSLCAIALDASLRLGVNGLLLQTKGVSLDAVPTSAGFVALMLAWTLIDGAFAGYVAARIGHRAPLPSALLVALAWMGLMIRSGWHTVPPWFLAMNVTMMVAGTMAGGAVPALRSARAARAG
jgi:hypothetical protein